MKPIVLDLAPRRDRRFALLAGFAALLAAGVALERQHAAESELHAWQAKWQRLADRAAHRARGNSPAAALGEDISRANRVVTRLGMPWGDLFSAVDAAAVDDVALLSVEPDAERRQVQITAEAKDRKAMLDYARALLRSPILRDGHLVSHQINNQDPQKPVRFTAVAIWPDGLAPAKEDNGERRE